MNKWVLLFIIVLFCNCGLFTPRDGDMFEQPETGQQFKDPFQIRDKIIAKAGNAGPVSGYNDLFTSEFKFNDIISGEYSKSIFIEHLQQMSTRYGNLKFTWRNGVEDNRGNLFSINGISYDTSEIEIGISNIVLERVDAYWKIASWSDFPKGETRSFFAP
jgi:hypothetical protein